MALKKKKDTDLRSLLIIGGGIAGIRAALDLANTGHRVHIVERNHSLGGQVSRLDKLYPTDHCAFCPLWTEIKRLKEHPLITVHIQATLKELQKEGIHNRVSIVKRPLFIDEETCVFCGHCVKTCPLPAIQPVWEHASPPAYMINEEICNKCGLCEETCPTGAIDLTRSEEETILLVDDVIWATGFKEADLSKLEEFGSGTHPDIMSAMEFEDWISEAGSNRGNIRKKSNLSIPKSIAFVQCAGARDKRMLPYCSAVCCMHALKQAHWVNKRSPEIQCTVFYTDLRTVGKNYYEYALRAIEKHAIELIRGRPGMILPLPGGDGIGIKYENTMTQRAEIRQFDMVVLNGALEPSLCPVRSDSAEIPVRDKQGFLGEERHENLGCGFIVEPADVVDSVIQASSAVFKAIRRSGFER